MNVVIFKLNSLGDNVVFVPAVQALRQLFPAWHITLVSTPNESALYGGRWGPQETIICPKPAFNKAYRRPWELLRWIGKIRRLRPQACLVAFDQSNVAHLVAKYSGARIRIGGNRVRIQVRGSLTEDVPLPADLRPVTWNWHMAAALARSAEPAAAFPSAPPPPDLRHLIGAGAARVPSRPRVVVHPGAGGPLNQWGRDRFAAVAAALARDLDVVWVQHGTTGGPPPPGATAAPVGSLGDLATCLASADLFLGNNSGPMHLANALGCRGVAVTGPTTTGWDPYWHRENWTVLRHPHLPCQPCEKTTVALEGCANLAHPMACLNYWTPERVEAACRDRLATPVSLSP